VVTAELTAAQLQTFVDDLPLAHPSAYDDVEVRLVLGAACATRSATVQQLVAALHLPYRAAASWEHLLDALTDRPAALRECVVVADPDMVLPDDAAGREEVLHHLHGGPYCLGGGFGTLVLLTVLP
jgi:hypothetical protein